MKYVCFFFFQAEDGIRDLTVTGVQTCALPIFVADGIPTEKQEIILKTLLNIKRDATLLKTMESRDGFKPVKAQPGGPQARLNPDWPDWRGLARDGHVPRLPARLPETAKFIWKKAAMTGGLAGLSVSEQRLILAERDFGEQHDVYRCLNAANGELLWRGGFPPRGRGDFCPVPAGPPGLHAR